MRSFLHRFFSDIIGLVFFLSSILKLMDPTGTALIVDSYLANLNLEFLRPFSKFVAEGLSLMEAVISLALLTGVCRVFFAFLSTAIILFFTLLSVWLTVYDPQMSCGCFGEAIELTHTQTLVKNLILLACCFPAFFPYCRLGSPRKRRVAAFFIALAVMSYFAVYSLLNVPLVDFTEFAPSHTIVSDNSRYVPSDEYPMLPVWDEQGEDASSAVLEGNVAVLSFYNAAKTGRHDISAAASFAQDAINAGYNVVALSTAMLDIPGVECYISDYKKLITLNRSNGGATLIQDGYIIGKTSAFSYPSFEELEDLTSEISAEAYIKEASARLFKLQGFIFFFLAVLILV